ncbi:hypothetical protein VPH35_032362 [Triticum aestivum]|uniref:uncharacterized protein n=1 Tax=Triticum aestivum TaxID=4565 RepID=UPI000843E8EB|nr:uncharacterized protein LOC123042520 [Triticum aestivum]
MEGVSEEQQSPESSIVVKEIMSLHRERRYLLASLTSGVSVWKRRGLGEEITLVRRLAGTDYTAPVQGQVQEMETEESASAAEQLGRYFDSIVHDREDLSHRMLSMAYAVVRPDNGAALSSYTADELVNSTSALMHACKELYEDTHDNEQAGEEQKNTFLDLHDKFLREPLSYENTLALVVTREEEEFYEKVVETLKKRAEEVRQQNMLKWKRWEEKEKERERYYTERKMGSGKDKEIELRWKKEREKEQEEREKKDKEEDEREKKEMATMEYLKKRMEVSEEFFADHRDGWETGWGSKSVRCGDFRDKTTLSPMHFTHYTPNTIRSSCGVTGSTLQIYSIQILELKRGLKWPLKLYGVVAARDSVDRNRNIVFSRSSLNSQELNENGSSLCFTGPSRAIVALGPVDFEIELKIEEGEESHDKELITLSKRYEGTGTSLVFENSLCVAELKFKQISEAVQATVLGVCVVEGDWPFEHGCRVACSLTAAADEVVADADEIVLLDCRGDDKEVRVGSDGYLHLSRNVVSVQTQGTLVVVIRTYLESGCAAQDSKVEFLAKLCQTGEGECSVGNSKVKIVVAWSLLVKEKQDLLVDCPAV